jgi:hypothetical protein
VPFIVSFCPTENGKSGSREVVLEPAQWYTRGAIDRPWSASGLSHSFRNHLMIGTWTGRGRR